MDHNAFEDIQEYAQYYPLTGESTRTESTYGLGCVSGVAIMALGDCINRVYEAMMYKHSLDDIEFQIQLHKPEEWRIEDTVSRLVEMQRFVILPRLSTNEFDSLQNTRSSAIHEIQGMETNPEGFGEGRTVTAGIGIGAMSCGGLDCRFRSIS